MSLYWKCQLVGWSSLLAVSLLNIAAHRPLSGRIAMVAALLAVSGILGTHLLRLVTPKLGWKDLPIRRLLPRLLGTSTVLGTVPVLALAPYGVPTAFGEPTELDPFLQAFAQSFFVLAWCLIYFGHAALQRVRAAEAEEWQIRIAAQDTELRALRSQLNPHFLFNSLNSLRALILEDSAKAQRAVSAIAALLRHTLQLSQARAIPLENELEAVKSFLELEGIRFEERLTFRIDAAPACLACLVPPMLVQTLAENAVKHGISRLRQGGMILVEARLDSGRLVIRVSNTGTLARGHGIGIGLCNSQVRMKLLFGGDARLRLHAAAPDIVVAEAILPALRELRGTVRTHASEPLPASASPSMREPPRSSRVPATDAHRPLNPPRGR